MASGKRTHHPVQILSELPPRGSVTLVGTFPACVVGAAYQDAVLQAAGTKVTFNDISVTRCPAAPGATGEPAQSLSMSYLSRKLN